MNWTTTNCPMNGAVVAAGFSLRKYAQPKGCDYLAGLKTCTTFVFVDSGQLQLTEKRGKILEAMAIAIPVVTTSLGAEGIPVEDMNNIVIANDPETFADRVVELFKDDKLYKRISRNSRFLVEKKFSWEKGVDILEQVLERTISE